MKRIHLIACFGYDMLTIYAILHHREAIMERQINRPKEVMVSMQKNQQYKETKIRLLHKLKGLDLVANSFDRLDGISPAERHWFKGYHVFSSRAEVLQRFQRGEPLSCFCLDRDKAEVHVAFTEDEARDSTISYLTFTYDTNDNIVETGVHFCHFVLKTGAVSQPVVESCVEKNDLRPKIVDYALMLPYIVDNTDLGGEKDGFNKYTMIYSDWEVLICNNINEQNGKRKGRVPIDETLFRSFGV